jgi:hypothetical protein
MDEIRTSDKSEGSNATSGAATTGIGIQKTSIMTTDEIAEKLNEVFSDVQTKIHDQWDWMEAAFYVECLRVRATNACPQCGESGLGCNQFGCWRAANPSAPAPAAVERLLEAAVRDLTTYASGAASITFEQGMAFGAALGWKGAHIVYEVEGVDKPLEPHVRAEAENIRDTANPCAAFTAGAPHHSSICEGDGHHRCGECKNKLSPNQEDGAASYALRKG